MDAKKRIEIGDRVELVNQGLGYFYGRVLDTPHEGDETWHIETDDGEIYYFGRFDYIKLIPEGWL